MPNPADSFYGRTFMQLRVAIPWILLSLTAACGTRPNPSASCASDGVCSDHDFPFCDRDGAITGVPGSCVAISCVAGEFGGCQGADELVCNAVGTTYDPVACSSGLCVEGSGCAACIAGVKTCTDQNTLQTCDANGSATNMSCSIGCVSDGEPHCKEIVPSNGVGIYEGMLSAPDDVTLSDGLLDLRVSTFTPSGGGSDRIIQSFDVGAANGGSPMRVIVARNFDLSNITIVDGDTTNQMFTLGGGIGRAVVFLATDTISITGEVRIISGAVNATGCSGTNGLAISLSSSAFAIAGGGGGGHATDGADGGTVPDAVLGGAHGTANGGSNLIPLRGGCPGGAVFAPDGTFGGHGGGAIQLTAHNKISVSAAIVADGTPTSSGAVARSGGGGGGGILLESISVVLGPSGALSTRGGGGLSGDSRATPSSLDGFAQPGGDCAVDAVHCGAGGAGAAGGVSAKAGKNTEVPSDSKTYAAGGGGGGLGQIRINTPTGTFDKTGSTIIAGSLSTGICEAR